MVSRFFISIGLLLSLALQLFAEPPPDTVCLVEPTEPVLMKYSAKFEGKTYYFCCSECVDIFEANPAKFVGAVDGVEVVAEPERNVFQRAFDSVWNLGSKSPALSFGAIALVVLVLVRLFVAKARPFIGLAAFALIAAAAFGAEALVTHKLYREVSVAKEEADLIHKVHASTFHEYGDPPIPEPSELPPRLSATYYRGNDERSEQLFNGGYYRTTDFRLDLCNGAGEALSVGDGVEPDDLYYRVRIVRAPGTPDFFWKSDRMANIFASRSSDKLLGRNGVPVPDAVPMKVVRPMWEWEFLYPLAPFVDAENPGTLEGIFYQCEKRYQGSNDEELIGARFHYAFQFSLTLAENKIQPGSGIWMGAIYRNRKLRIWEIPGNQWLSTEPIPVIEGENTTTDPKLLGIEGHLLDKN